MHKIRENIELLEDLELDDPVNVYPIFDRTVYYDHEFKEVYYDALDKATKRGEYMTFGFEPFEKVFQRQLDFIERDGKCFFTTKEVVELIRQNRKNSYAKRNYPCFLR
ncbi:MAG: hypothetical protein AAGL34_18405 [Bacteroidota bacterium]